MYREPWFRILDVTESTGLSLADIAREEAKKAGASLDEVRGPRTSHKLAAVRRSIYQRARLERPDLTSSQIGAYLRKEGSTVRHAWRLMGDAA